MNKQNLGYRLGKLYRKFRQWQHPTVLKWLYVVLIFGTIFVLFFDFFVWLLIIVLCGIALVLYSDIVWGPTPAEQEIINELKEINKKLQKKKYKYNDNLTGSGEDTGNGIDL